MAEKNKKPEIRFKGYSEDWEEHELGKIGEFKNGMNFGKEAMGHGFPFVNLQDVFGKNTVDDSHLGLAVSNINQRKDYSLQKGDVLFIRSSVKPEGVGETALVTKNLDNTTYSGFIIRLRFNLELDDDIKRFIFTTTNIRRQILTSATSSANTNINQDSLQKILIMLPKIGEHSEIGAFFKHFDSLTTHNQRKYDKLLTIKKAMLEKMFPKNGSAVPEIRFKGFTEAWEERKLGDIGYTYTGLSGKTKDDFGHGEGKFVTYMNVFSNSITQINLTEPIEVDGKQNEVKNGDVFFTTSSETPEEVGMSSVWFGNSNNTYLNSFCFGYRPVEKINNYYLAHMLRSSIFRKRIIFLAQGISRYNISKIKAMEIAVPIPSINEQEKIGSYFAHLDKLITLHQCELEMLKNIKKACLEKMFV